VECDGVALFRHSETRKSRIIYHASEFEMNPVQKILIVDDRKENLVALRQVLHGVEAEIIEASNGNEALAATLDYTFAMAILDVMMPGMSGFELARHLRGDDATRLMPIVFVTAAYPDEHHVFGGYEAGGIDYIVKPYAPEVLLAKVRIFLEMDRQRQELQRHRDQLEMLVAERTAKLEHELAERKRSEEERRKLQDQLVQAQKMESVGTLAGGIAHDFNNILTSIIGYAHWTLMNIPEDSPLRQNIERILEAADRAAHLTSDLLLFSRKRACEREAIDLNDVVDKAETFLQRMIGEDIMLKSMLHDGPLPILADGHQLGQVLMNLAVNARDAMGGGGGLTLQTNRVVLDEDFVAAQGYGKPGVFALLAVSDSGTGMDAATRLRIFEPFFTTKEVGKGTGLGLAVVYGIVKQHDGFITVDSEPGDGTTFSVYLPLMTAQLPEEACPRQDEAIVGGSETILLAEDDELVRNLVVCVLMQAGYTVIEAVNGEDAVQKFRDYTGSIQLLLLDLIMPRMNGKEACDEIRKVRPEVKVIIVSGYAPDIVMQKASFDDGIRLVYKPVTPMDLLKAVRSKLDGGG
jgi:signal transduction histidine kinase